jgi:hypothetical protein
MMNDEYYGALEIKFLVKNTEDGTACSQNQCYKKNPLGLARL